ncbi:hypothetical protein C2G38_2197547 [Gigaspora rosea]|uniref:Uncharacterized protein n=1 Tax=Gigaspora rosea TaxID=44941 RepID=A0A397UWM5_9GLOM|nr:hypothetical protein C2G38_2197547 [Gigaspora rosea]
MEDRLTDLDKVWNRTRQILQETSNKIIPKMKPIQWLEELNEKIEKHDRINKHIERRNNNFKEDTKKTRNMQTLQRIDKNQHPKYNAIGKIKKEYKLEKTSTEENRNTVEELKTVIAEVLTKKATRPLQIWNIQQIQYTYFEETDI